MSINMKEQAKILSMKAKVKAFRERKEAERRKKAGKIDLMTGESS